MNPSPNRFVIHRDSGVVNDVVYPEVSVTSSASELPVALDSADIGQWRDEFDVVVLGFGIAGGCAAVAAASAGASVLVLERAAVAGGTAALAGGHFYLGGGTAVQAATGHHDTPEAMYDFLVAVSEDPELPKIRAYCEGSVEHFTWLETLGFQFERSFYAEKAVIQPDTQGLMYTGNEKVWPFRESAAPAPRGHKVPMPGDTGGASIVVDLLLARAVALGVTIRYETSATNLVMSDRAVTGVAWRRFAETGAVRADATVIAAGGFVMNEAMVREHIPAISPAPMPLGTSYDDGLGIRLGLSAGGVARGMDKMFITAPPYPPAGLLTGIIVNKHGHRFVAEDSYHSRTSAFVLEQPDHAAYLIVDEEHLEMPVIPLVPLIDGWETIAEMEVALSIPTGNLESTLRRYNDHAERGEDPDFHKHPDFLASQNTAPWGAFDLTPGKAFYTGFTLGGLSTSVDGEVLGADGQLIAGLYAAGASASNLATDPKSYASGTQLGEGSFFGRRAGTRAAAGSSRIAPVRLAGRRSRAAAAARHKQAWIDLFADDAIVEDPIGPSHLDPAGVGHRGKEAISAFWDSTIASSDLRFHFDKSYICGDEEANLGHIEIIASGYRIIVEGVFTYRVDADGKITALRAYWEVDKAMATAQAV